MELQSEGTPDTYSPVASETLDILLASMEPGAAYSMKNLLAAYNSRAESPTSANALGRALGRAGATPWRSGSKRGWLRKPQ